MRGVSRDQAHMHDAYYVRLTKVSGSALRLAAERTAPHTFHDFVAIELAAGDGTPEYRAWLAARQGRLSTAA